MQPSWHPCMRGNNGAAWECTQSYSNDAPVLAFGFGTWCGIESPLLIGPRGSHIKQCALQAHNGSTSLGEGLSIERSDPHINIVTLRWGRSLLGVRAVVALKLVFFGSDGLVTSNLSKVKPIVTYTLMPANASQQGATDGSPQAPFMSWLLNSVRTPFALHVRPPER
eukprot:6491587-Amphidinium_carterae.1